jgi:hypothetical protein
LSPEKKVGDRISGIEIFFDEFNKNQFVDFPNVKWFHRKCWNEGQEPLPINFQFLSFTGLSISQFYAEGK